MNEQWRRTPIIAALEQHAIVERVSLHVPGHKAGRVLPAKFTTYASELARLDATELHGLDDLYQPVGPIAEAQELAAQAYGSDRAYFLVGGSTVGNLAAVLATVEPGQWVIVARNSHQSVWHAIELAGARALVISPPLIQTGAGGVVYGPIADELLQRAIAACPDAVACILTSPTYPGVAMFTESLVQVAHTAGLIVIADEAHGAHLSFHPDLPRSAIQCGADLVIQSPHKMSAALTQTGLLHLIGDRVNPARVLRALRMIQTSSPSYLLLASIDAVRAQLATEGSQLLASSMQWLRVGRLRIQEKAPGTVWSPQGIELDPYKWLVTAPRIGYTGCDLADALRVQFGIFAEWADEQHVLFAWSYANSEQDVTFVGDALLSLQRAEEAIVLTPSLDASAGAGQAISELSPLASAKERNEKVVHSGPLRETVGGITCAAVTVYPPGVPLLLAGETITETVVACVEQALARGIRVDGVSLDGTLCYYKDGAQN